MYAKLETRYALRGWKGIPYALLDTQTLEIKVLDAEEFGLYEFLTGEVDLDFPLLSPRQKECLETVLKDGVAAASGRPAPVSDFQRYKKSESGYIQSVIWSVTGGCDLRCRHCYMGAGHHQYPDLTTGECLDIIEQMEQANVAGVDLSGGEPLLRPDFWQLVDALRAAGILILSLHTNGLLLDDDFFKNMEARSLDWCFVMSLDCLGAHDWLRGVDGAEEKTIAAIKRLGEMGRNVYVKTKLHSGNLDRLLPTYEWLKTQEGVKKWKISFVMALGDWKTAGHEELPPAVLFELYEELVRRYRDDGQPLALSLHEGVFKAGKGSGITSMPHGREAEAAAGYAALSCSACRARPYLLPNGRLMPCWGMVGSEMELQMPLLTQTRLAEVYGDPQGNFRKLADILTKDVIAHNPECQACMYSSKCGGGCRADALLGGTGVMGKGVYACHILKNGYYARLHALAAH
ncbi:MAG: radical SAM protein [Spirochaetales bacterium]|jgi:radical SAM protein with 4Fe4S-binding SPASM domain|nr:radical SAM protein [Spirochaetales bacterium]